MNANKTILVVEDDVDDQELLLEALQNVNPSLKVMFAENGVEALSYLKEVEVSEQLPGLIILDLNMPCLDGKETFQRIKEDGKLGAVPIVIFTSSLNPHDKALFSQLNVEFISKPYDFTLMNKIVGQMLAVFDNN
jgi:CheY-like chemotaxis protein